MLTELLAFECLQLAQGTVEHPRLGGKRATAQLAVAAEVLGRERVLQRVAQLGPIGCCQRVDVERLLAEQSGVEILLGNECGEIFHGFSPVSVITKRRNLPS